VENAEVRKPKYGNGSQQTETKYGSETMTTLLKCLDSDADASVVIVRLQWLNQLQNYARDTSKYSP